MPQLNGVIETAIYVDDLQAAVDFYTTVLQLELMSRERTWCAFNVADRSVFLVFLRGASTYPNRFQGGTIPPHDGHGPLHMALAIALAELPVWEKWLSEKGVIIEGRVDWEQGGRSIYFRDPDGHLIELATPGLWPIY